MNRDNEQENSNFDTDLPYTTDVSIAEDFIKEIQKCQAMRESGDMSTYSVVLNEHNTRDNLRIVYQGGYVSITRGNCKVLFHGSLGVICGAIQSITKQIKEFS